ncbi:MAG: DUF5053 domain-containing protein [Bacteroidales bacterium]|nr:DUF5053 domain-containing protein [Bacteroidales bacterium]
MTAQNKESVREAIADIRISISLGDIARRYFGKSTAWFYQRLNGTTVNGKPAEFKEEERQLLKGALLDLADRIKNVAEKL